MEVRFTKEEDLLEEDLEEDLPSSGRSSYEGRIFLLQEGLLGHPIDKNLLSTINKNAY